MAPDAQGEAQSGGSAQGAGGALAGAAPGPAEGCLTSLLPSLARRYERACVWVASDGPHLLGFFLSTYFCGPVGLHLWEKRLGGGPPRRVALGLASWFVLALAALLFLAGFGWLWALLALLPMRPLRRLVRWTGFAGRRPAPEVPSSLTSMTELSFAPTGLDWAALAFAGFVFLALVASRDDLVRNEMVTDSDPAYHMAVARHRLELGRIPRWDLWEYAPFGRPHLYQPGVHLLIAAFARSPEHLADGFCTLQILLYPAALILGWYFARWLMGPFAAFAALIVLSMDFGFALTQAMVLPAAVVTAFVPLLLMCFLTRRATAAALILAAMLYTHMGVPPLVVLGLVVYSARHREYVPVLRTVTAWAGFLYLPWILRTLPYLHWFGTASGAAGPVKGAGDFLVRGLLQLQVISPVVLVLAFVAWRRKGDRRLAVVKSLLVGFLPMLLLYGGRYFMHTAPLWAAMAAVCFEGWLKRASGGVGAGAGPGGETGGVLAPAGPRRRGSLALRAALLVALAFVPLPVVTSGMPGGDGMKLIPGPTGALMALGLAAWRAPPDRDFERLAAFLVETMRPLPASDEPPRPDGKDDRSYREYLGSDEYARLSRRIVHVGRGRYGSPYLADRIAAATGHRTDSGGWGPEVRSALMLSEVERVRASDPECLFVFRKKREDAPFSAEEAESLRSENRLEWTRRFGERYLVGGRGVLPGEEIF